MKNKIQSYIKTHKLKAKLYAERKKKRQKGYMKKYKEENREKLRVYKMEWMRNKRQQERDKKLGIETAGTQYKKYEYKKYKINRTHRVKKGHCINCTILLKSKYAVGHNGYLCGPCLEKVIHRYELRTAGERVSV